jgi:hypothetical protein
MKCENKTCGKKFESDVPNQRFCTDSCRNKAWRENKKPKPMNGLPQHHDFEITDPRANPFGQGIQGIMYTEKLGIINELTAKVQGYTGLIEQLREEKQELREGLKDQKHKLELELREQKDLSEGKIRELKDLSEGKIRELNNEIKELIRDKGEAEKGSGLNGFFNKALEKENGIEQLLNGGATLLDSFAKFKGQGQGQAVAYPEPVKEVADLLAQGSAQEQQKVKMLITAIVNAGGNNIEGYLDTLINQINPNQQ